VPLSAAACAESKLKRDRGDYDEDALVGEENCSETEPVEANAYNTQKLATRVR
jgi:hypothetical protein